MTREDAIVFLNEYTQTNFSERCRDAHEMAISDMEKQIPKKPTKTISLEQYIGIRNDKYLRNRFWCPNCGADVNSGRYCVTCGQLLDRSDLK